MNEKTSQKLGGNNCEACIYLVSKVYKGLPKCNSKKLDNVIKKKKNVRKI